MYFNRKMVYTLQQLISAAESLGKRKIPVKVVSSGVWGIETPEDEEIFGKEMFCDVIGLMYLVNPGRLEEVEGVLKTLDPEDIQYEGGEALTCRTIVGREKMEAVLVEAGSTEDFLQGAAKGFKSEDWLYNPVVWSSNEDYSAGFQFGVNVRRAIEMEVFGRVRPDIRPVPDEM